MPQDWLQELARRWAVSSRPPASSASSCLVGRDDSDPDYYVLYVDGRGVSRVYRMSFTDRNPDA